MALEPVKFSELSPATSLVGDETIPIVQGGGNKSATPDLLNTHVSGAHLNRLMFTPGGDGVVSIWRIDVSHAVNPRTATISSVSTDTITLSTAIARTFYNTNMAGVSYVRIWNTTKDPDQSAWVKATPSTSQLQVTSASDISTWSNGDTIQIGDPVAETPGTVVALDISPMLQALFGSVFRQTGILVKSSFVGSSGDGISITPTGVAGSLVAASTSGASDGVTIIPCSQLSPISNSNLIFLKEYIATTASISIVSSLGVFV